MNNAHEAAARTEVAAPVDELGALLELIANAIKVGGETSPHSIERALSRLEGMDGDAAKRAFGMVQIAKFYYVTGKPASGLAAAERARGFSHSLGMKAETATALNMIGICSADMADLPRAMEAFAEGLNLSQSVGETHAEAKLWISTGAALVYGGLFKEAQGCFQRVMDMARENPVAQDSLSSAYANFALCCLNTGDIGAGLAAIKRSLEWSPQPTDAHFTHNLVLQENYITRLLIEVNDFDGATTHAKKSREYANLTQSPRSDIPASTAEGLAEVFSGQVDIGITRLTQALHRARELRVASREILVALVKALEHAGRHDEALKYLRELLDQQRRTAEAKVLTHLRTHLAKLHDLHSDTPIEDLRQAMRRVETQVEIVEGRVAKAELLKQRQELFQARVEAMERLAVAAELRDDATGEHAYRVGRLACIIAQEAACDDETLFMIEIAARLHDVGKIGIPDGILLKPGAFNTSERLVMEMHAEIGADVLAKSEIPHIKMAEEIARHHHERWDGRGYPAKIGGEEIPLPARITALADVFDALTHKRAYKPAWSFEAATSEILAGSGRHFDPELTKLFLAVIWRLKREHGDLDYFLGEAARSSPFIQARSKIRDTLLAARGQFKAS